MLFAQQNLTYQVPVNILQWILGPSVVVLFSTCRTVLSSARQVLSFITSAIAPEITFSFANRDMKKLLYIFHHSGKIVFAGIPIANLGAFLFCAHHCQPMAAQARALRTLHLGDHGAGFSSYQHEGAQAVLPILSEHAPSAVNDCVLRKPSDDRYQVSRARSRLCPVSGLMSPEGNRRPHLSRLRSLLEGKHATMKHFELRSIFRKIGSIGRARAGSELPQARKADFGPGGRLV
jgi:hypothetical protein